MKKLKFVLVVFTMFLLVACVEMMPNSTPHLLVNAVESVTDVALGSQINFNIEARQIEIESESHERYAFEASSIELLETRYDKDGNKIPGKIRVNIMNFNNSGVSSDKHDYLYIVPIDANIYKIYLNFIMTNKSSSRQDSIGWTIQIKH